MRRLVLLALLCLIPALVLCQQGSISYTRKSTVTVVSCGTLCDDLIYYWNLDEASGERADSVGTADLTDNNTVGSAAGKHNLAASFVAANDESLSHNAFVFPAQFTLSMWINVDTTQPQSYATLIACNGVAAWPNDVQIALYLVAGELWYAMGDGTAAVFGNVGAYPDATWTSLIVTFDTDKRLRIYIDNALVGTSDALAGSPYRTAQPLQYGAGMGFAVSESYISGLIDEPAIWSRVLTADERTDSWNSGSGKFYNGSVFALYFREQPWRHACADWLYYLPQRPLLGLAALKLRSN